MNIANQQKPSQRKRRNGVNSRWQQAKAFVVVAGGKVTHELEPFLVTLRAYHSEPVYCYTDEDGQKFLTKVIQDYNLRNINIRIVTQADFETTRKRIQDVHNASDYWSREWIWWKLEALRRTIVETGGQSVMLIDSDMVFTGRLDGRWYGECVLSPFWWPHDNDVIKDCGVMNAGMFMTHVEQLLVDWLRMYETGAGGYYEQKCMEYLQKMYHCDYMGADYNFGKWRLRYPHLTVNSLHGHIGFKEHPFHDLMIECYLRSRSLALLSERNPKVLFIQIDGCNYSRFWLKVQQLKTQSGVQVLNHQSLELGRELEKSELSLMARGKFFGQDNSRPQLVITENMDSELMEVFRANGWAIVCALSHPETILKNRVDAIEAERQDSDFDFLDDCHIAAGETIPDRSELEAAVLADSFDVPDFLPFVPCRLHTDDRDVEELFWRVWGLVKNKTDDREPTEPETDDREGFGDWLQWFRENKFYGHGPISISRPPSEFFAHDDWKGYL